MRVRIEASDQEFLDQLHRLGQGTVSQICEAVGVTATAVRQRLTRLQSLELVSRTTVKADRGRPHHVYQVTESGLRQLGDNYRDLAMILWREIKSIEEEAVRDAVFGRIREAMIDRFSVSVGAETVEERFVELQSVMVEQGYHVEVDFDGTLPILRETSCPYQELAATDSTICEIEQQVFGRLLGMDVEMASCCRDGDQCCEFQPAQKTSGEGALN